MNAADQDFYVSTSRMARDLSVTGATLLKWADNDPHFPKPCRVNQRGKRLWDRAAVLMHVAAQRKPPKAGEGK